MHKIPIAGGPHTGKSTLIKALAKKYPGANVIEEQASVIIARELNRNQHEPNHRPLVPWLNMRDFNLEVMQAYIELEKAAEELEGIGFQDRCIWDSMFYCNNEDCADLLPLIRQNAKKAGYKLALFCEPVGNYRMTAVRQENEEEALKRHKGLKKVYERSGLPLVVLPNVGVEERLGIIEGALAELLAPAEINPGRLRP